MTRLGAAARSRLGLADVTPGAARGLLYVLVLVFLITGGSYYQSSHAINRVAAVSATVTSEHRVQIYACRLGNDSRAQQVTLWTHIAQIAAGPPHETAPQKRARQAKLAAFLAYVRGIFAPRDCAAIYRIKPP